MCVEHVCTERKTEDADGDRVVDAEDRCPAKAEDRDDFQDDDGCPDPDNDADGVPDENDKCMNVAEDRNDFRDDDGCPDEPERSIAVQRAAQQSVADDRELERQRERARDDGERDRRRRERLGVALADAKIKASRLRVAGIAVITAAGCFGLVAGSMLVAGELNDQSILDGGFASGADISDAADRGQLFNGLAIGFGVGALSALGAGIPLLALSGEPTEADVVVDLSAGSFRLSVNF